MNSAAEIKISIAVVTRNRPEWLRRCLKSWRTQIIQPFEIVISDDSDDSMRPEIRQIAEQFEAQWIAGPRRGLYANRNHVAVHCRGTHVFSADDDHEHPVDLLEKCLIALQEDSNSAWCLGEVWSWEDVSGKWGVPGELRLNGVANLPKDISNTWAWSDGATLCPRRVFDSGLSFCEAFRFGSSFLEFGCLLRAVGQRIRILKTTGVIHHAYQAGSSFQIPIEECASRYFSTLMLALVYQPSEKHSILLAAYLFKQILRQPLIFIKAFPWALREKRKRTKWFRQWQSTHIDVFKSRQEFKLGNVSIP
jgi:glycosyltransferase involved in cell wall biosynthesis